MMIAYLSIVVSTPFRFGCIGGNRVVFSVKTGIVRETSLRQRSWSGILGQRRRWSMTPFSVLGSEAITTSPESKRHNA